MENESPSRVNDGILEFQTLNPHINSEIYPPRENKGHKPYEIEFYSKHFDINTEDIIERVKTAILNSQPFFELFSEEKRADLYGPFWVSTTVLLTMFMMGAFSNVFLNGTHTEKGLYKVENLSVAAFTIYLMLFIWPFLAYMSLKYWGTNQEEGERFLILTINNIKLVDWICLYGYSLTPLVPYAILSAIVIPFFHPNNTLIQLWQWFLLLVAFIISTNFLVISVWTMIKESQFKKEKRTLFFMLLLALHGLIFIIFKLLFF